MVYQVQQCHRYLIRQVLQFQHKHILLQLVVVAQQFPLVMLPLVNQQMVQIQYSQLLQLLAVVHQEIIMVALVHQ